VPSTSLHESAKDVPGPLELKCLQAIWQMGEANVKDVRDVLTKDRKLAYTTVMTTLDRLEKKGTLRRHKSGKAFVYAAAMSESEMRQLALQHLIDEYFNGSRADLLRYLEDGPSAASTPASLPAVHQEKLDASLL
jgi:predicted transcriptional regulator